MKKILWLIDGVGWGYDILSAAIAKELPGYEHVFVSKNPKRRIEGGRLILSDDGDELMMKNIDDVGADLIISMSPMNKRFLRDKSKAVVRFSGTRAMSGWKRY